MLRVLSIGVSDKPSLSSHDLPFPVWIRQEIRLSRVLYVPAQYGNPLSQQWARERFNFEKMMDDTASLWHRVAAIKGPNFLGQ